MTFTLHDARELAAAAHAGQRDKQGRDYFLAHLTPIGEALMDAFYGSSLGEHLAMAGYLHDIIEDCDSTPERLRAAGVPVDVVEAVDSVSRRTPDDERGIDYHEPYPAMIERARQDPLGVWVKIADNRWNHRGLADLAKISPTDAERLDGKYTTAFARLTDGFTRENLTVVDRIIEHLDQSYRLLAAPSAPGKHLGR